MPDRLVHMASCARRGKRVGDAPVTTPAWAATAADTTAWQVRPGTSLPTLPFCRLEHPGHVLRPRGDAQHDGARALRHGRIVRVRRRPLPADRKPGGVQHRVARSPRPVCRSSATSRQGPGARAVGGVGASPDRFSGFSPCCGTGDAASTVSARTPRHRARTRRPPDRTGPGRDPGSPGRATPSHAATIRACGAPVGTRRPRTTRPPMSIRTTPAA